jgi:hypothetical protein
MTDDHKTYPATRDPIAIWDDILELVAEDDAETGEATEEDMQWSQRLDARVKSRVAELRRRLTPTDVSIKRGVTIPAEIQALDRDAVVARLEILRQADRVLYQHRELTGLSDNGLRLMLAIAVGSNRR